jgi:hypothetical protein
MKFVADGMLGKLTRWLRLAGQDVVSVAELRASPETEDGALIKNAKSENRTLITSDVDLYRRAKKAGATSFLVKTNDLISQFMEISELTGQKIQIDVKNSRCPMCNGALKETDKREVENLVPEKVLMSREQFWVCGKCGKVYWEGTHWKTIIELASKYNQMVEKHADT